MLTSRVKNHDYSKEGERDVDTRCQAGWTATHREHRSFPMYQYAPCQALVQKQPHRFGSGSTIGQVDEAERK